MIKQLNYQKVVNKIFETGSLCQCSGKQNKELQPKPQIKIARPAVTLSQKLTGMKSFTHLREVSDIHQVYEFDRSQKLGSGSFATVYKATRKGVHNRSFALKVIDMKKL